MATLSGFSTVVIVSSRRAGFVVQDDIGIAQAVDGRMVTIIRRTGNVVRLNDIRSCERHRSAVGNGDVTTVAAELASEYLPILGCVILHAFPVSLCYGAEVDVLGIDLDG